MVSSVTSCVLLLSWASHGPSLTSWSSWASNRPSLAPWVFLSALSLVQRGPHHQTLSFFRNTVKSKLEQNESGPGQVCDRRKGRHHRQGLRATDGLALNHSNNECMLETSLAPKIAT